MNDATFAAYSDYVRTLADHLLLRDWEVVLDRNTSDSGTFAQVRVMEEENFARVWIKVPEFFHHTPNDQREWLTHECLHLHLDRPARIVRQLAEQLDEDSACQFAKDAHRKEIEICVQRFARIIAPQLPLPPEVGDEGESDVRAK